MINQIVKTKKRQKRDVVTEHETKKTLLLHLLYVATIAFVIYIIIVIFIIHQYVGQERI